jgi:hypothetical protein
MGVSIMAKRPVVLDVVNRDGYQVVYLSNGRVVYSPENRYRVGSRVKE